MSSAPQHEELVQKLKSFSPQKRSQLRREALSNRFSGHALLAEALKRCGIRRIYGIGGTPVDQSFTECAARGIRPISVANQQASVLMAAAGNYVAGTMEAVVLVSAGPAVTNTLTGLLVARDNGWPVLVFGGRRALTSEGVGYFQELDAIPLFSPVTKRSITVRSAATLMQAVFEARAVAEAGRRGPVYLDLPEDVLDSGAWPDETVPPALLATEPLDAVAVEKASRLVAQAKRPLLILGEDIRWTFRDESLRALVDDFGIPFITSPMGRGYLPDTHPLCGNEVRRWFQGQADVVIMAGAWFDWRFRYGTELAPDACVVHADADRTVLGKNVNAAVAILGEPGEFLTQLAGAMKDTVPCDSPTRLAEWHARLRHARAAIPCGANRVANAATSPMQADQLYAAIRQCLPDEVIVTVEGNICLAAAQKALCALQPATWLDPGRNGLIGGAIPFAMGAKLARPDRPVVALCSDTGFSMSAMNLEAAVRHQIPITVVIANNDGNSGSLRQKKYFPPEYPEKFCQFLPGLRYERIMETFGGHAEYVREPAEVGPALERALGAGVPACVNAQVDPDAAHLGVW